MTQSTENLIRRLAHTLQPVRPLPRPCVRAALWFALSTPYFAILLFLTPWHTMPSVWPNSLFLIEEISALTLGLGAAIAAFASVIPGHNRWFLGFLSIPLVCWVGSVGQGCIRSFMEIGPQATFLGHSPYCLPFIVVLSAFPAIALGIMLRRGAPLTPRLSTGLAALAALGLANFFSRLFHPEPFTLMLLVWHVGGVLLVSVAAAMGGSWLLNWRSIGNL